jgi:hypothetical protein
MSISDTFREAPPTRKPSMSSFFASSAEFAAFTEPTSRRIDGWSCYRIRSHVNHIKTTGSNQKKVLWGFKIFLTQVHNTNIEKNMVHGSMNRVAR